MNPEAKKTWLQALRSDEYKQARNSFSDKEYDGTVAHCCLAVLSHEAAKKDVPGIRWAEGAEEPEVVAFWNPEQYSWEQVDDARQVMEEYPETAYNDGATPADAYQEQWAWVRASEYNEGMLPDVVRHWAGLDNTNPKLGEKRAADWNDNEEKTFTEIADLVEENL